MSKNGSEINIVIAIDHASITGGQAKVALDSALGLKRAGYNPIVFAAVAPVDPRLIEEGVEVVCLDQADLLGNSSKFVAAFQGAWNFRAAKELRRLLSRLPSERTIVHVHGWAKALSASIAQPIRQSGLPCVYTMHEYFMFCGNGGFYDFQSGRVCNCGRCRRPAGRATAIHAIIPSNCGATPGWRWPKGWRGSIPCSATSC